VIAQVQDDARLEDYNVPLMVDRFVEVICFELLLD
jgi:hypothetical protein